MMKIDFGSIAKWPRFRFKKLRILVAWIGGALCLFNAHISDDTFRIGVPLVILGELMRIWAGGHVERKGGKLAVSGPFAYIRNPLYLGNFLIGLGVVIIFGNPVFMVIFLIGFGIVYWGTIRKEETVLQETFGESYSDYYNNVPRLFPKLSPYKGGEKTSFQWRLLLKHREHVTTMAIILGMAGLYLWEEIILEHGNILWKEKIALGIALAMIIALIVEAFLRNAGKKRAAAF